MCGGENVTNGSYYPVFSKDIAFVHHFMAPCPPHPLGVLVVLATPVKSYLKWREIRLAIQCAVDTVNYSTLNSYRFMQKHMQAALIILEIIY